MNASGIRDPVRPDIKTVPRGQNRVEIFKSPILAGVFAKDGQKYHRWYMLNTVFRKSENFQPNLFHLNQKIRFVFFVRPTICG